MGMKITYAIPQIGPKLRSFPRSLSGAQKLQIWTVHVFGVTISIKYEQTIEG